MNTSEIVLTIAVMIAAYLIGYYDNKRNTKWEKEHPKCVCSKCHTLHRKGVIYEQQNRM